MPGIHGLGVRLSFISPEPLVHFRCSELSPDVQVALSYTKKSWLSKTKIRPIDTQFLFASFAGTLTQGDFLSSHPILSLMSFEQICP